MKPWGYSYHLDCWNCQHTDDLEVVYRYLEKLVYLLDMNLTGSIYLVHGPVDFIYSKRIEKYPNNAGISGFAPLIQSGVTIHTVNKTGFVTIDIYSCKEFLPQTVLDFTKETFKFSQYQEQFLERGNAKAAKC